MDVVTEPTPVLAPSVTLSFINKTLGLVSKGVSANQPRFIEKAIRQNVSIRKSITSIQVGCTRPCAHSRNTTAVSLKMEGNTAFRVAMMLSSGINY